MTFDIHSSAFAHEAPIPGKYTCDSEDLSPPLNWSTPPEETRSLALIVDDPDAPDPDAPKMVWVHWVLFNLPPKCTGLPEGVREGDLPDTAQQGLNDWKATGYRGPCPPIGRHRYYFKLYALDKPFTGLSEPTKAGLEAAMDGHILAEAVLMGTYSRAR